MVDVRYYLEDYSDETVPCDCTLQGWADWLSKPSEDWNRDEAATNGETFAGFSIQILGDVRVEYIDGEWQAVEPIPDRTESFYKRHFEGGTGWDAEFAADTIADATDCLDEDDSPSWYACTRDGPRTLFRFNLTQDGPRLTPTQDQSK